MSQNKTYLALDVGEKRIGVAVGIEPFLAGIGQAHGSFVVIVVTGNAHEAHDLGRGKNGIDVV